MPSYKNVMSKRLSHSRRIIKQRKVKAILEVLKETGKINLSEAHHRVYPNASKSTCDGAGTMVMQKDGVMEEVERLLQLRDKDILKKVTPEVIVQDIIDDLNKLNQLRDSGELGTEDIIKAINAKAVKQKLLGLAIGAWKSAMAPEAVKSNEELIRELEKLGEVK